MTETPREFVKRVRDYVHIFNQGRSMPAALDIIEALQKRVEDLEEQLKFRDTFKLKTSIPKVDPLH